jgi:hypothetical protein
MVPCRTAGVNARLRAEGGRLTPAEPRTIILNRPLAAGHLETE